MWDGDDFDNTQWTRVMIKTANLLHDDGYLDVNYLCCYKNEDSRFTEYFGDKLYKYSYDELGVYSSDEVGMVLLYITSNLLRINRVNPILVLCTGVEEKQLKEFYFSQNKVSFKEENNDGKYNLAINLIDTMKSEDFKWMATSLINSFKKKNEYGLPGIEKSKIVEGIERIDLKIGGARKTKTKTKTKKSKSPNKKNKKKPTKKKKSTKRRRIPKNRK